MTRPPLPSLLRFLPSPRYVASRAPDVQRRYGECGMIYVATPPVPWQAGRRLTHSLDYSEEGLGMEPTHTQVEVWRTIPFEPRYEASSLGNIRHARRRVPLRLTANSQSGYLYFSVYDKVLRKMRSLPVHRAVCWAFQGEPPTPRHVTAHGNGTKLDNRSANLRWATQSENTQDAVDHCTWVQPPTMRGEESPNAKLTGELVREIRALQGQMGARRVAILFGVSRATVRWIWKGQAWRHVVIPLPAEESA